MPQRKEFNKGESEIAELTGLALLGNIEPPDPELNKALQPVIDIMHEKYMNGVLIVKSVGADLCVGEEKHFFNQKMLEEYFTSPQFGLTSELFADLMRTE